MAAVATVQVHHSNPSHDASHARTSSSPTSPGVAPSHPSHTLATGQIRPRPATAPGASPPPVPLPLSSLKGSSHRATLPTHNSGSSARTHQSATSATSATSSRASATSRRSNESTRMSRPGSSGSGKSETRKSEISSLSLVYARDRRGSVLTSLDKGGVLGLGAKGRPGSGGRGAAGGIEMNALPPTKGPTTTKEDEAVAKWRKWAVEQPHVTSTVEMSPLRGRKISTALYSHSPGNSPGPPSPSPSQPSSTAHTSSQSHPATSALLANPPSVSASGRRPSGNGVDLSPTSSNLPSQPNGHNGDQGRSLAQADAHEMRHDSVGSGSDTSQSRGQQFQLGPPLGSGTLSGWETADIYTTDSVRALRDVELAVDEEILARTAAVRQSSRLLSSHPRLSPLENPFVDIAPRLASRRVRPFLLELVQALGHYIDTLWAVTYPDDPCPWGAPATTTQSPGATHTKSPLESGQAGQAPIAGWSSRMITAVHAGRADGHVLEPDRNQVMFWRAEVEYALKDTGEVVGNHKKVARAFGEAFRRGQYGEIEDGNVFGDLGSPMARFSTNLQPHGDHGVEGEEGENGAGPSRSMFAALGNAGLASTEGGNIARLLNDLEEVLWGDAPPRLSDLEYDLPADFDPYAAPTADDLAGTAGTTGPGATSVLAGLSVMLSPASASLADFLGNSAPLQPGTSRNQGNIFASPSPIIEEVFTMPDMIPSSPSPALTDHVRSPLDSGHATGRVPDHLHRAETDPLSSAENREKPGNKSADTYTNQSIAGVWAEHALQADDVQGMGRRMTLEEIGRKRHAEWLAGRGKEWE